jgi:hypothetical protein
MTHGLAKVKDIWTRMRNWVDTHPRTGWYIAMIVTGDLLLNILQLFD